MKIFKPGDLVRLANSDLQMIVICYENESGPDDVPSFWRCAWEEDGVIATTLVNQTNLVLINSERRRLVRFDLRFPSCRGFKNVH